MKTFLPQNLSDKKLKYGLGRVCQVVPLQPGFQKTAIKNKTFLQNLNELIFCTKPGLWKRKSTNKFFPIKPFLRIALSNHNTVRCKLIFFNITVKIWVIESHCNVVEWFKWNDIHPWPNLVKKWELIWLIAR